MDKVNMFFAIIIIFVCSCETLYYPETENMEEALVVDARIVYGAIENYVFLKKSNNFNARYEFEPATKAVVKLIDDTNAELFFYEAEKGKYKLTMQINPLHKYKLSVIWESNNYESQYESISGTPKIDTLYGSHFVKVEQPGGVNNVKNFPKTAGYQFYIDINNFEKPKYFRIESRKILQYYFPFDTVINGLPTKSNKFCWFSVYPTGAFNIAGPAEYTASPDIIKHPVEFFPFKEEIYLGDNERGSGWIYIISEYQITQNTFNFYRDLNNQLNATGKIFDPMHVQARNNVVCTSNPDKLVLGNFEISTLKEYRYYIHLDEQTNNHIVRKVFSDYFIPEYGIKALEPPVFWER